MEFVMPAFACIVVVFGLIKKVPVFDVFISGAKEGVKLLYNIAPTIMGLVFAVDLLQSSGAIDVICSLIQPTAEFLGFPKEIVPLVLLRPVSGSGSTALLTALYKTCGPDSFAGRVASVLAGSSETTFYAIASTVCYIVKAVLNGSNTAMTVSSMMHGEYGVDDVCLSTLNIIGRNGVVGKINSKLTEEEIAKLQHSADVLKATIAQVTL